MIVVKLIVFHFWKIYENQKIHTEFYHLVLISIDQDHIFPQSCFKDYCDYFQMTKKQFFRTLNKFVNKEIFLKQNKGFILKDTI